MIALIRTLTILSFLLLGAHFMRDGENGLMAASLLFPFLLLIKRRWSIYILSGVLVFGAFEWLLTAISFYDVRVQLGMPAGRMLAIMSSVALVTLLTAYLLYKKKNLDRYIYASNDKALAAVFFLTALLISIAHIKVKIPVLLIERFFPTFGWLEIFLLSLYAVWITSKMLDHRVSALWRRRIWSIFSFVFFAQLILGLLGFETFLMTGNLHLPVPAMIMAGPLYRWGLSIMVFLFLGSIVLLGPAWCSHLCYIGIWDDYASRARKKPKKLTKYRQHIRIGILILVAGAAISFGILGVPPFTAAMVGLAFGIIGVGIMVFWSRKAGAMTHCVTYCPVGLLAVTLGKISPFRIKINDSTCTDCGICRLACRYDALNLVDIKNRKPNINCTLCGDCIGTCEDKSIEYKFMGLKGAKARTAFIVIAVAVHTVFLSIGRI